MIHPNIVSDINGEYMGADFIKKRVEKGIITAHLVFGIHMNTGDVSCDVISKESSDMMESLIALQRGRWIWKMDLGKY